MLDRAIINLVSIQRVFIKLFSYALVFLAILLVLLSLPYMFFMDWWKYKDERG